MVMFCLMTRRRINLVRLVLDFTLSDATKRSHAALPYVMFFTRVFMRAQLSVDRHRNDVKHPTTTMKTFYALGLKSQDQEQGKRKKKKEGKEKEKKKEKEKEEKKKDKKKKDFSV